MTDLLWSSALSPQAPSIPRRRDWSTGMLIAALVATGGAWWYALGDHSLKPMEQEQEERVVVALGGSAARKIEAPPKDSPVSDKPPVLAERAADAPPIAPPPEPRPVQGWLQGDGAFSSGTGGTALAPSPPPPPAAPPAPRAEAPVGVSAYFTRISTERYYRLIVYPQGSLDEREEGVGVLAVTITPDGTVLGWKLVETTGKPRLDGEIKRVAGKVQKLDPLPADFPGKRAVVQITITFKIED